MLQFFIRLIMKNYLIAFFLLCIPMLGFGQSKSISGKIFEVTSDQQNEPVPFANLALVLAHDTTVFVAGEISDLSGAYTFKGLEDKQYLLRASFVGYKTMNFLLDLTDQKTTALVQDVLLEQDQIALNEVVVKGSRSSQSIDKTVFTFSNDEMKKAFEGRELVASLPNLRINHIGNSLATIDGKSILILINGIKATDADLKLIAPDKIQKVEYYDVPPIRYMNNAEVVVNVLTKKLDSGWSGDVYAVGGMIYSGGSTALSYVNGNNKLTLTYNLHVNNKRDVANTEHGVYEYKLNDVDYNYTYDENSKFWGNQNFVGLLYARNKPDNYDLQLKGMTGFTLDHYNADRSILLSQNNTVEDRTGALSDKVRTFSPTFDAYFVKYLKRQNSLTVDVVGTLFDNKQNAYSYESGANGFEDRLNLNNTKQSVIGEVVYNQTVRNVSLTGGYRGAFNFLTNRIYNSLSEGETKEHINTQKHYFYGEVSGRVNAFMYRASLGGNYDVKLGDNGFKHLTFTPVMLIGYKLNAQNNLRLSFKTSTLMPNSLQMSEARILVMDNFFKTGNPNLKNSTQYNWNLSYNYAQDKIYMQADLFYDYNKNTIYDGFNYADDDILIRTDNAKKDISRGARVNFRYSPFKFITIGGTVSAMQQVFAPTEAAQTYRYWSYPATVNVSLNHKDFRLDYFQMLGGSYVEGLYLTGIEKASYVNLSYRYKQVQVGVRCLFPFIKDKVKNRTIPESIVRHEVAKHLKRKDHTFGMSISWNFRTGKQGPEIDKKIYNDDSDNAKFNLR